jgi:hypothetical protein
MEEAMGDDSDNDINKIAFCGQDKEVLSVKPDCTYGNH